MSDSEDSSDSIVCEQGLYIKNVKNKIEKYKCYKCNNYKNLLNLFKLLNKHRYYTLYIVLQNNNKYKFENYTIKRLIKHLEEKNYQNITSYKLIEKFT